MERKIYNCRFSYKSRLSLMMLPRADIGVEDWGSINVLRQGRFILCTVGCN